MWHVARWAKCVCLLIVLTLLHDCNCHLSPAAAGNMAHFITTHHYWTTYSRLGRSTRHRITESVGFIFIDCFNSITHITSDWATSSSTDVLSCPTQLTLSKRWRSWPDLNFEVGNSLLHFSNCLSIFSVFDTWHHCFFLTLVTTHTHTSRLIISTSHKPGSLQNSNRSICNSTMITFSVPNKLI